MSKDKSLDTIRIKSKKHNMPREMVQFKEAFDLMKKIGYVEEVGVGRYRGMPRNGNTLEFKGYDDLTNFYKIDINYGGYLQEFYLKIKPEFRDNFRGCIENCLNGRD